LSVFKAFPTFESQSLVFRADSFNAFNMASYAPPSIHIPSGVFGVIQGTSSAPRKIQLSLDYKF